MNRLQPSGPADRHRERRGEKKKGDKGQRSETERQGEKKKHERLAAAGGDSVMTGRK